MEKSIICSNKNEREKKIKLKSYCNLDILLASQRIEILEGLLGNDFLFPITDT